jgi:hypothetical protein
MSTSRPEGQPQLDDYPLGLSGSLYRPSSYFNRLDPSSNARLGRLVDISEFSELNGETRTTGKLGVALAVPMLEVLDT